METSRPSSRSSREQIILPTIEGFDDSSPRLSLSRATTSTVTTDYRGPTESPPSACGSTASPGACASTASTAVVGGNNPLPLVSTTSVRRSEAAGSDAGKVTVGAANLPDAPLPSHYDAIIFHDVRDLERAELFRRRLLDVLGPVGEGLRVGVFGCEADAGKSYYEQLEDTVRRSTYLMLFVTRNLCEDRVMGALLRDQLLSEMLENSEKRWCLIPIWTEPEEEYTKPMALRPLVGIAERSMSDKLRRQGIVRLFTDKRSSRLSREQAEIERRAKEDEQKLQKLKDEEAERQHREQLQQLNEHHQRELRNAQRQDELSRQLNRNALARREEENLAVVGNQLMQMQFLQQNARHVRDQLILEEWQRDAKAQAQAMASCPIPGGIPPVLRPRGGDAPLISDGGLWVSTVGPEGRAYVAVTAGGGSPAFFIPEPQLPDNSRSSAFSPLTVAACRAPHSAHIWANERQPLLPPHQCTPEETLRQAHDLLRQLNLTLPHAPPSFDPQPPSYSQLFGSTADVLPSHNLTGAQPSGKNASAPATGVSAIRNQEKKPQPLPDSAARQATPVTSIAQETDEKHDTGAVQWPAHIFGDVVSKVEDIRRNQLVLLHDCAEQRRQMLSTSLPERHPAASPFFISSDVQLCPESRSSGLPGSYDWSRLPERQSAPMAELPAYRCPSESYSGVLDSPGWQACSTAVQPRDASLSSVTSGTYISSVRQPLQESQPRETALPAAAGFLPIDLQHQPQLPPGLVAMRVEDVAAMNALRRRHQQTSENELPTGVQLPRVYSLQQVPPPGRLPFSHAGMGRLPQSLSVPAYIGGIAGNASAEDPISRRGQHVSYSDSSPLFARNTSLDHHLPSHVDCASVPGRATSYRDATSPRAPEHSHRQSSNQRMPASAQCTDTVSQHRISTYSQPSSWATSETDFSSFGSGHYPAARACDDASLGTGSSSASEGAGSFSSGPLSSAGSDGSAGGASSLDSGHGPAASALRAWPTSVSSAARSGNIPLTVLEQYDSSHPADIQPLTLHPTR